MDKNKKIILVSFLLMAAVPSWVFAVDKPNPVTNVAPSIPLVAGISDEKELAGLINEDNASSDIALDSAWGARNPFDSAAIKALPDIVLVKDVKMHNGKFLLGGVLWTGYRPSAIINDKVVGVGSVISGMIVKEIKEKEVMLSDGVSQIILLPAALLDEDSLAADAPGDAGLHSKLAGSTQPDATVISPELTSSQGADSEGTGSIPAKKHVSRKSTKHK